MRLGRASQLGLIALASALMIGNVSAYAAAGRPASQSASDQKVVGVNVVLSRPMSAGESAQLSQFGPVLSRFSTLNALTMRARISDIAKIEALPFVKSANQDAERVGKPVPTAPVTDFTEGQITWDLAQIEIGTKGSNTRNVAQDGDGVYVAVLDTGLMSSWPYYFGTERIASTYGAAFGGGGGEVGTISRQPNKWSLDQDSHGTHVTSTIIGYNLRGAAIGGVAPKAKVIPVKVLNQNGSGWSSVVAAGIDYVTDLKLGALSGSPVVINMSLGGSQLDGLERAAIDRAVASGVIIVASAGNSGTRGMGYPGAYAPVISVASSGWTGEFASGNSWWVDASGNPKSGIYISDFSSRQLAGQELDVVAPGSLVVGPYQVNGQISYYFLGGTSMASPHVAGVVALMAQLRPSLSAADAEYWLKTTAQPLDEGCATPAWASVETCWDSTATGAGLVRAAKVLAVLSTLP